MQVIDVTSVSKKYKVYKNPGPVSLKNGIQEIFNNKTNQEFWAINDVSFSLNAGNLHNLPV